MYDARIVLRKPRQRYDKNLLPNGFCTEHNGKLINEDDKEVGTAKKVFEFVGYDGFGNKAKYDALEVRYNGWIIPCYRMQSEDNAYVICQRYSYKAVRES